MADTLTDAEMDQLGGMPETLTDADMDRLGGGISMDYTTGWRTGRPSTEPVQLRAAATGNSRGLMNPQDFEEPKDPVERWATRVLYAGPRLPEVLEQLTTEEGPDIRGRVEQRTSQMLQEGKGPNANSSYGTRMTSAFASGLASIPRGVDRSLAMALMSDESNHAAYLDELTPPQREFVSRMRQKFAKADPVTGDANWLTGAPIKAAEMAPQMLASVGIGVYAGGALPMAAFWFTQTYPDRYDELKAEGLTDKTARAGAVVSAAVESAVEIIEKNPFDAFGKKTVRQGIRKVVVQALKNYGKELSEETLQAVTSETVKQVASRYEGQSPEVWKSVEEVARQTADAAAPLALMMGGSAGIAEGSRRLASTPPSQQDAARFVAGNEEMARAMAADPNPPSRKAMQELGFDWTSKGDRAAFADHVRNMVSVLEDMKRATAATEQLDQSSTPVDDTTQEAAKIADLANQQEPPAPISERPEIATPASPPTPVSPVAENRQDAIPPVAEPIVQAAPPVEIPSPAQEQIREEEQTQAPEGRPEGLLNESRVAPDAGPAPVEQAAGGAQDQKTVPPDLRLANSLGLVLDSNGKLGAGEFFKLADQAYGGTRAEGKYGPSDAYDALELAVNQYLRRKWLEGQFDSNADQSTAKSIVDRLQALTDQLPTQTNRSGEKDSMQQFSTPPAYAYAANWIANIGQNDVALEPSAGTGSLAVHGMNAGAQVYVNELSKRRAQLVASLQPKQVFTENAEQIANILPGKMPAPTVVVMNPPFSQTAGRMGDKKVLTTGATHIEQALKLMAPNGRLVAIVGRGMDFQSKTFGDWWRNIARQYNVRANVAVSGDVYKKYGTHFGTRLLVIDKTPPSNSTPVTGEVGTIGELIDTLAGVRNDRASAPQQQPVQPAVPSAPAQSEPGSGPVVPVQPAAPAVDSGGTAGSVADTGTAGGVGTRTDGGRDAVVEAGERDNVAPAGAQGAPAAPSQPDGGSTAVDRGPGGGSEPAGRDVPRQPSDRAAEPPAAEPVERIAVESTTQAPTRRKELTESVFEPYQPAKVRIPGAKPHPASIVESAAMAAVQPPTPMYRPALPKEVIERGLLSSVQLEAVVYAGEAHSKMLPAADGDPEVRRGIMIGDGTGVGKGREVAGIFLDNWMQGRRKGVWLSMNEKLFDDAKRDWSGLGQDPNQIIYHGKIKAGGDIKATEGILFSTYGSLIAVAKKGKTRLEQIVDWLGEDFDGVIAFDEAHKMGNLIPMGARKGKPSKTAVVGVQLQAMLPKARVVYVSATAATEVQNLAYANRLGLWGYGTAFTHVKDFIEKILDGGVAAMELVARDMKAMGAYLARNISYNDGTEKGTVQYERLEHVLSDNQRNTYDTLAEAWQSVLGAMGEALHVTGGDQNSNAKSSVTRSFWAAHQSFFNQIITAMQTPSIINGIERDIAEGRSVVIQLTNTYKAAQDRALADRDEDTDLDELDISPREALMRMVEQSFPVAQYEDYVDENGNVMSRPVIDSNGNIVQNAEAVAMRDALLERLSAVSTPDSPIDMIIRHFGVDNVAEVTGRDRRIIQARQPDGLLKTEIQSRSSSARKVDIDAFMNDKKRILIFSEAGGTGASYHADRAAKNQRHRRHYLLQAGWRADSAIQGLGRTHRSNQEQAPTYILVHTDLKGQKRFLSTIARRLSQLGAITKGERRASSSGIFTASDNLESKEAKDALYNFFKDLSAGNVPEIGLDDFQQQTGLKLLDNKGSLLSDLPPVTQFLNRLLSLKTDTQNLVFDAFEQRLMQTVERAMNEGTLDQGTETFRADRIQKASESVVHTDPESGAKTKYVKLRVANRVKPKTWDSIKGKALRGIYQSPQGKIYAVESSELTRTDAKTGQVEKQVRLIDQSSVTYNSERHVLHGKNWQRLDQAEAERLWNEAVAKLPEFKEHEEHLITGAILPIWDRLLGKPRVFRLLTDEGEQLLGRVVPPDLIKGTLQSLGVTETGEAANVDPAKALEALRDGDAQVVLANGWRIKPSRVQNEQRLEIIGPDFTFHNELEANGVIRERIGFKTRYFIPMGNAEKVFNSIVKYKPVSDLQRLSRSSAAESAQSAADDADPDTDSGMGAMALLPAVGGMDGSLIGMGLNLLSKLEPRKKVREDRIPDVVKAPRPDVEERLQRAHGADRPSLTQKIKDIAEAAWHKATRAEEHLPKNATFAAAREFFRLLKGVPTAAADEVNRTVAAIIDPMGPNQLALFERKLIVDNMLAAADRGEPLRFGVESVEEIEAYRQQLDSVIAAVPEVQQALDARKAVVHELVTDLVHHDLLPPEALGNAESYYHQQVLTYLQAGGLRGSSGAERRKRSFQKRRVRDIDSLPAEFDYNTKYIEAEAQWMTEAQVELRKEKMIRKLAEKYDRLPALKKQAFRQNLTALVGGPENMQRIDALKRLIRESSEGPNRNESDERLQRRTWIAELTNLDPTYPMRRKIARLSDKIQRMISSGQVPLEGFARLKAIDPDADLDLDGQWFNLLSFLAQDDTTEAGRAALGIFKAIQDRNALFREQLGNNLITPERLLGDDLALWQPEPGNVFFRAFTLPEKVVEAVMRGAVADLQLTPDQLHAVTVMGGPRRQFAMPTPLVNQLVASVKPAASGVVGKLAEEAMRMWKVWRLLSPLNAVGYTLRNVTGDLDPIIAGAPEILTYVPDVIPELQAYYRGGLSMSKELRDARDLNVLDSALTAEEIPDLRDLSVFKRFYESKSTLASLPAQVVDGYFERVKRFSKFREAILRYAAYKYYLQGVKGDSVAHFGGAKPETVRALARDLGPEVAAAHLSRNLLGDYGNLTVMGNWLRAKAMPFYSWVEVNAKRYPRMLTNAFEYGKTRGDGKPAARAAFTGMAIAGIGTLTTLMWLFNNLLHPDEEKDLTSADRANPHIIVKRNEDGTIMVLRNTGALGDFLEWFGVNTLMSLYPKYAANQLTLTDLATAMAKDPVNKVVQGLRPDIKGAFEIAAGQSTFPDVFNPRSAPRDELAAETLGLRDPYRSVAGRISDSGARGRSHWLQRLIGVSDPRRAALQEVYDLRDRFLKREGKAVQSPVSGSSTFRNMREAVIDEDYPAFVEARRAYLQEKKSFDNFKRSLQSVDPIGQRLSDADEKRFAEEFLTGPQREKLKLARDFAGDTTVKMWTWWQRASEDGDSSEEKAQTEQAVTEEIGRRAATLARPRPAAVSREQRAAGKTIRDVQAEWQADVDESMAWLKTRNVDAAKIRQAYQRYLYAEVKSPETRAAHMQRFMGQLAKMRRAS